MPYKVITDVGKLCGRLAGAAFEHRDLIVNSLLTRWQNRLPEGEDFTALHRILTYVGEDLTSTHDGLVVVEDALQADLREDRQDRSKRDGALQEVRQLLIDSKQLLDLIFGPGATESFWEEYDVEVPLDAGELQRLGNRVRRNLLSPDFPRPPLRLNISADLEQFAQRFDGPLNTLKLSVLSLHQGTQASSATLAAKENLIALEEKEAVLAGRLLEALTAYAGHPGVAKRIRQSRHRIRKTEPESGSESTAPSSSDGADGRSTAPSDDTSSSGDGEPSGDAAPPGDGEPSGDSPSSGDGRQQNGGASNA